MVICKPKITIGRQGFLPPIIWASHPLRTISGATNATRHQGTLHSNITVAARYITTSRSTLRATRWAQYIARILGQKSTNSIPHNCRQSAERYFSGSLRNMDAEKIDGTAIAKGIRTRLQEEIKKRQETNPRYQPSLIIVQGTGPIKLLLVLRAFADRLWCSWR